jgi:hypothetical protein
VIDEIARQMFPKNDKVLAKARKSYDDRGWLITSCPIVDILLVKDDSPRRHGENGEALENFAEGVQT